jgi:GxxExxY protein
LRSGHLEKVYENALVHRLRKQGLKVEQQTNLTVYDEDGTIIGHFVADLVIEDTLIAELKACKMLGDEHIAQVLGYLRASHMRHGILINFGAPKFQMRKFVL